MCVPQSEKAFRLGFLEPTTLAIPSVGKHVMKSGGDLNGADISYGEIYRGASFLCWDTVFSGAHEEGKVPLSLMGWGLPARQCEGRDAAGGQGHGAHVWLMGAPAPGRWPNQANREPQIRLRLCSQPEISRSGHTSRNEHSWGVPGIDPLPSPLHSHQPPMRLFLSPEVPI